MKQLSIDLLGKLEAVASVTASVPVLLPERVLQFGSGVLLRALPDFFIDKANKQGLFLGKILVVKSTGDSVDPAFISQDNLYTIAIRGIEAGKTITENIIADPVSRVLHAGTAWPRILEAAHNGELKIIISNTTESGIHYLPETIFAGPPVSFPAKLLAFLFERFKAFSGTIDSGMVILPTELIPDNGSRLKDIVLRLAADNKLGDVFTGWLSYHNTFCNTLVDRIVPGRPSGTALTELEGQLGYSDELACVAEPYCLWAIEGGPETAAILGFHKADSRMVISTNIQQFRELKLHILNAGHTLACGPAFMSGLVTVNAAMENPELGAYIGNLLLDELAPAVPYRLEEGLAAEFAHKVLDRFRNPGLQHEWSKICTTYTGKLKIRVIPVLVETYKRKLPLPRHIAFGFAAYIRYMKSVRREGAYYGSSAGMEYLISDDYAGMLQDKWAATLIGELASAVLGDTRLWDINLNFLPGFTTEVQEWLDSIEQLGMKAAIIRLNSGPVIGG